MNYKNLTRELIRKVKNQQQTIAILEVELLDAEAQLQDRNPEPAAIVKVKCLTCKTEQGAEFLNSKDPIGHLDEEDLRCPECGSQDTEIITAERRN